MSLVSFIEKIEATKSSRSLFKSAIPLKCLLPRMHRRHLFQLRPGRYIDEYRFIACQCIGDGRNQLIWTCDSHAAYPKCFSDANGIHFAGEIDAEIAVAVVQPLEHLDPSKAAVIEQDDGDRQVQAGDGRQLCA